MDENQIAQAPVVLDISEKREKIANCIINLKKGLKKMRRQDVDEAIAILLMYDGDLKKKKAKPVEKHGIEYASEHHMVQTDKSFFNIDTVKENINVVIINENRKPVAYAIQRNIETTVNLVQAGKLLPLGDVIIEKWMKEHYPNEVSFMSLYATAANGHIEIIEEDIVVVNGEVTINGKESKGKFKVTKISNDKVWLNRGNLFSWIPLEIKNVKPTEKTKVTYFKIDSWLK